jgi:hypothetical protein
LKFIMPQSPEARFAIHTEWLGQVRMAIQEVSSQKDRVLPELQRHEVLMERLRSRDPRSPETKAQIVEVARLRHAKKDLRMKELCLREQAERLQERILSLQQQATGDLT